LGTAVPGASLSEVGSSKIALGYNVRVQSIRNVEIAMVCCCDKRE
jgi:hypothetical protein